MHRFTGFPSPAAEYERPPLSLDALLIRFPLATIFARFVGDAMIFEGINDGDLLIIEKCADYSSGWIVLAFVDGERLVRKYEKRDGRGFLCPANPDFREIAIDESIKLIGRVTHRVTHFLKIKALIHTAS